MNNARGPGRPRHDDVLTPAEWRIANAVRHGMSNRAIAERRAISLDAVKYHLANIKSKLGLATRDQLRHWTGGPKRGTAAAIRKGQSMPEPEKLPALGPIGQISRSVADIAAAETFYREIVGLKHLYTFGNLAFFDCDGTRLMLSAGESAETDRFVLYFQVPEINAAFEALKARGASFIGAPHMIHRHQDGTEEWMAFFNDNETRPLAIMSQTSP